MDLATLFVVVFVTTIVTRLTIYAIRRHRSE